MEFVMKIVFRIITAALALCVIPAAFLLPFIKFVFSAVVINVGDDYSIKGLYNEFFDKTSPLNGMFGTSGDLLANPTVKMLMPAAITFLVFFCLALVISLVIFFFAVFSNKRLVMTCLGGGGLLSVIGAYIAFGRLASPLLDGTVQISDFLNMGMLGFLVDAAVKFDTLKLTSAPLIMALTFGAIVIWGLAYILTEDESEKKQRRLKKANKKKA
jgi:hypothetical protein